MIRAARLPLIFLAAALFGVVGCQKRPKSITPLPGAAESVPTSQPPVVNTGDASGLRVTPGRTVQFADDGSRTQPLASRTNSVPDSAPLPTERIGANKVEDVDSLKADTVYFDFDKSVIKASEAAKLSAVADFIKAHPEDDLVVQGHCDERGTEEYNRALGERRALAVREALVKLGSSAEKITTVSYGKDRPVEMGHDEAAWSKNRRSEFVVLAPPALK